MILFLIYLLKAKLFFCVHLYIWGNRHIGLVDRVFANGQGDLGLIPDCVIPETLKMALDTALLNSQQYKVRINCKGEQSRERSSPPSQQLSFVAIEKEAFVLPSTMITNFTYFLYIFGEHMNSLYSPAMG